LISIFYTLKLIQLSLIIVVTKFVIFFATNLPIINFTTYRFCTKKVTQVKKQFYRRTILNFQLSQIMHIINDFMLNNKYNNYNYNYYSSWIMKMNFDNLCFIIIFVQQGIAMSIPFLFEEMTRKCHFWQYSCNYIYDTFLDKSNMFLNWNLKNAKIHIFYTCHFVWRRYISSHFIFIVIFVST